MERTRHRKRSVVGLFSLDRAEGDSREWVSLISTATTCTDDYAHGPSVLGEYEYFGDVRVESHFLLYVTRCDQAKPANGLASLRVQSAHAGHFDVLAKGDRVLRTLLDCPLS